MILPTLCSLLLGAALAKPQPRALPANTTRARRGLQPGLYSFTSINYPDDYDNNYKQRWVFRGSEDQDITVECDHFDLEDHRRCRYDFLKINGDKYCGTGPVGPISSPELRIAFKTDFSVTQSGFYCLVTVPGDGVTTEGTTAETTAATTEGTTAETTAATTEGTTQTPGERSCGIANREVRIVGGEATEVNEYPWQVGLVNTGRDRPWCGGSIINTQWILTAAHCTQGESAEQLQVLLRKHNTDSDNNQITRNVAQIVSHPDYNSNTFSSDISLLRLSESIVFSNRVSPVCLPTGGDFDNVEAIVTGWGTLSPGGQRPDVLHEVTVNTMLNTECDNNYREVQVDSTMICADVARGGNDSCQGDSGGPLVTDVGGRYNQIGIVSWGRSCADQRWPGVYSRVTEFSDWIASITARVRLF